MSKLAQLIRAENNGIFRVRLNNRPLFTCIGLKINNTGLSIKFDVNIECH